MSRAKALLAASFLSAALGACFPPALSEAEMSDTGIRTRLEQTLRSHRELDLHAVTIDVHLRIVTLSGIVNSWDDKRKIEQILSATPGIEQSVINLIVPE